MKHYLYLSAAIIGLVAINNNAYAQSYSKGGESSLLKDTKRIETEQRPTSSMYDTDTITSQRTTYQSTKSYANYDKSEDGNPYNDFTGLYGGGNVGYAFTEDLEGFDGGLFAGYGFEHDFSMLGAYAGLEFGYDWSSADGTTGGTVYEKDHAWMASFRPGVTIMEDGLGYAIIGYSNAEIETATGNGDFEGLQLGLGGQFNTNTAFKTRLEYVYTDYGEENIGSTSFDLKENQIKLGAVFQF